MQNYISAALRNFVRNRFYSAVGIAVLAIGLSAAILMALYIRAQWNYDRISLAEDHSIPAYERTYLAATIEALSGQAPIYDAKSPVKLAELLKLRFAEIETTTRITDQEVLLRRNLVEAKEKIYWADSNVFDLLPLSVLNGNLSTALQRPDGIVVPLSIARKYFGDADPIGQSLLINDAQPMTVTAVIEDLPSNTTQLESGIFASGLASQSLLTKYSNDPQRTPGRGLSWDTRTYLRLAPNASIEPLQTAMQKFGREYTGMPPMPGLQAYWQFIRYDQVHSFSGLNPGKTDHFAMAIALGLLILLVACAVFINLATARSAQRALEVGIRKACGANRSALTLQFMGETLGQVMLAAMMAIGLAELLLPTLNAFTDAGVVFDYGRNPALLAWIAAGALLLGIITGLYPAVVLASLKTIDVLGKKARMARGISTRSVLVTMEFAVLIVLLIVAAVIYRQRFYATHEALRVDAEQVLIIRAPHNQAFKDELRALPGVRELSSSDYGLLNGVSFANFRAPDGTDKSIGLTTVEAGIFGLYGLKPIAGQVAADDAPASPATARLVINESAIRRLGLASPTNAIGQTISLKRGDGGSGAGEIIAVVPDFTMGSVQKKIEPWVYRLVNNYKGTSLISIKLSGKNIPETLVAIDKLWSATGATTAIDRFFLSDHFQALYLSVIRQAHLFALFSGVAVLLACMGLIGLAASTIQQRTKEIGIRKAMGASTAAVMRMLTLQFTKPVLYANLLAWPIAALAMNRWLRGFAYHVDLEAWIFIAATTLTLVLAALTVSAHCYAVARAKPVTALRYE
ncbi:MAG: hypothetical protein QM808_15495 [Steroidobacteraceae bacterium]